MMPSRRATIEALEQNAVAAQSALSQISDPAVPTILDGVAGGLERRRARL
jgi:hypothetical protein